MHVPFCARKCEYCAFFSEALQGELVDRYVEALVRELELVSYALAPRTVFFGGGTPSLLSLRHWETIFRAMERLGVLGAAEWTIECNPATVSLDKARLWRDWGVNRVSMGVQSLHPLLLARLGRVHTRDMVFRSFETLRRSGFTNLNLDLMFAIPGQTLKMWRATLDEALALQSEHVSCYEVIYEEDTALFDQLQAGEFSVDEDLACAMYEALIERAEARGFRQYEIANFAKDRSASERSANLHEAIGEAPFFACRHNVNYWRGGSYFGLGPGASGYVQGVRSGNWANTQLYCEQLARGRRAIAWEECLPPLRRAGEIAAFGLRMTAGWAFSDFTRLTGFDLRAEWKSDMEELVANGWGHWTRERFRLTRGGLRFADAAAERFLR